jgi:ureidoglycolate hydrolase
MMTNNIINIFKGDALLRPQPIPEFEDHPLTGIRDISINHQNWLDTTK